jgi:hypothetical protein
MTAKYINELVTNGMIRESNSKAQINLRDQVKNPVLFPDYYSENKLKNENELFPTPCVQDYKHREPQSRQQGLSDVVRAWPTPTARDYKDGSKSSCANLPVNGLLGRAVHESSNIEGQLSATWTESLMGYPNDWTDIEKESPLENRYPQAWIEGTWEEGLPRVIKGQKNRRHRIEALGNSIVPQIPYLIFMTEEFDKWRKEAA